MTQWVSIHSSITLDIDPQNTTNGANDTPYIPQNEELEEIDDLVSDIIGAPKSESGEQTLNVGQRDATVNNHNPKNHISYQDMDPDMALKLLKLELKKEKEMRIKLEKQYNL